MIILKGCKRCGGDIAARQEDEGTELYCLACGNRLNYNIGMLLDLREKLNKKLYGGKV